jgi:O-acetyl-ADP-ribose deacetylase (regulator of RNase III)
MPFEIVRNDITKMYVDAIVNPTNSNLYGTAGVDGAIHKIEGTRLREATSKIGTLAPGECALTKAFKLPAGHIIHTVGPIWKDGNSSEEEILRSCYKNSLELAKEEAFETIAFPLISSGSYGCPKDLALNIAVRSIGEFLLFNEMTVYLVVFDKKSYQLSEDLFTSVEA